MSSDKEESSRFEKTFSRKNKETNNVEEKDELLTSFRKQTHKKPTKTKENNVKKPLEDGNKKDEKKKKLEDGKKKLEDGKKKDSNLNEKKAAVAKRVENSNKEAEEEKKRKKRKAENGEDVRENKKAKAKNEKAKKEKVKEKEEKEGVECAFPTARITRIVKSEGSDYKLSAEAVFLINKAAENFVELFSEDSYGCAVEDRKSFVGYKHLSSVVSKEKRFDFLSDFVPEKVSAEKALAERKPSEILPS